MELESFFAQLRRDGSAALADWPAGEELSAFGLRRDGVRVRPEAAYDPLVADVIRARLSARARGWLRRLDVLPAIGSTNAELMARAAHESQHGCVCTAEVQVQGRGRRGRSWASPFGATLAVSLGIALTSGPAQLSGVSLVVGLAVLDALEPFGVTDAALKWPNDVLLGDGKLGGILIELTQRRGTELVIGIGLNVNLPASVRAGLARQVADLSHLAPRPSRSELLASVISRVTEFVSEFETLGFAPFRAAFDARHRYHGRDCVVIQGEQRIAGTVAGVTDGGELLLTTAAGLRTFHGGEVSLRQPAGDAG